MRWVVLPEGADPGVQHDYSQILAVHAALLPTSEILFFGGDEHAAPQWKHHQWDHTRIFNCGTSQVASVNPGSPGFDVFCCGHAMLEDGRVLVAGGTQFFLNAAVL
jgi:hypothetical protein